jgi:hypothetical protein
MKCNLYMSDQGWEGLKQLAYETGYVRGVKQDDRPRGMSAFITALSHVEFKDTRPEYMQGTGQWMTGLERVRQRCLVLAPTVLAALGYAALAHEIYPYRMQLPVANGFRRHATLPVLHAVGGTPRGSVSVLALVGPLLDAIGTGHLSPVATLPQAPPSLYQRPSQRYKRRERIRRNNRTLM